MSYFRLVVVAMFILSISVFSHAETIVHMKVQDAKELLLLDILKLSLSKSAPSIEVEATEEGFTSLRAVEKLKAGELDVFWAGIVPKYEDDLMPVHIPVLKGMLGHRIFIIEKGKQHLFDDIQDLDDLKSLKAGQGTTWGDTQVLLGAKIPTVTTLKYHNLFPMLEGDRFDYFPRAIHEPWSEIEWQKDLNLTVEERVLLVYPFAMYFFVAKDNKKLHDLIYKGFETAIQDGSYDKLFYSNPLIKDALSRTKISERVVIRIPNPSMGPKTPFDREEFWLDLENQ